MVMPAIALKASVTRLLPFGRCVIRRQGLQHQPNNAARDGDVVGLLDKSRHEGDDLNRRPHERLRNALEIGLTGLAKCSGAAVIPEIRNHAAGRDNGHARRRGPDGEVETRSGGRIGVVLGADAIAPKLRRKSEHGDDQRSGESVLDDSVGRLATWALFERFVKQTEEKQQGETNQHERVAQVRDDLYKPHTSSPGENWSVSGPALRAPRGAVPA